MAFSWSARRQLLYYTAVFVLLAISLWFGYKFFLTSTPNCNDGRQNNDERGVDCGGSCLMVCKSDARAPIVLWTRSFETSKGYYTSASYIQNPNTGSYSKNVKYSFQLFDDKNLLIVERSGAINLPPIPVVPIIDTNIETGNRIVARTLFSFANDQVWFKSDTGPAQIRVTGQKLSEDGRELSAVIVNDSRLDAQNTTVTAVLFDSKGIARGASRSNVSVSSRSSSPVFFTWPAVFSDIVRAEIIVLPRVQ